MGFFKGMTMKKFKGKNIFIPFLFAIITLSLLVLLIVKYSQFNIKLNKKDERSKLTDILISKKSQIEKALYSRIYYTKGVAAYVSLNPDISNEDFYKLADELIKQDSVINSMALSKDCIITDIYPHKGHEAAIGLDLLAHPARRKIVESTINTKNTFVAGPVELIEGGIAFISYTPIFAKVGIDSSYFWGVNDIVILKDKLFNEIKLVEQDENYKYALKGIDGYGENGEHFWGDSTIYSKNPVSIDIYLPTGNWVFSSIPINGWQTNSNQNERLTFFLLISSVLISILVWLLTNAIIKIRTNEKELKALFASMQDIIIEFNRKGDYIKIAPTNLTLLVKPPNQLLGKNLFEVFDKDNAEFFFNAITECFETKKLVVIDYQLNINDKCYWFHARIAYISENAVLYVAHDNTNRKIAEDELIVSREKLLELNATKDKFFSIIAHDLKNPLGSFKELTKMLHDDYTEFSEEDRVETLRILKESAFSTYSLLENLLEWSRSQRGKIKYNPIDIKLSILVNDLIDYFRVSLKKKNLSISINIPLDYVVYFDTNMLNTILRNLISNAIKFTNRGGNIEIGISNIGNIGHFSEFSNVEVIYVKDNGIGMSEDILGKLFRLDENISSLGTNEEHGTGLGLILCKEFLDKNGGKILVESELQKGSTFIILLPKKEEIK